MTTAARTISFTYNSITPTFIGRHSVSYAEQSITYSFDFLVEASSPTNLLTAVNTTIASLQQWNKQFTVTFGSTTNTYSHSTNSGFLGRPSVTKVGSPFDNGRCQRLRFTITVRKQRSDQSTGFVDGQRVVTIEPNGRYTIRYTMNYTATTGSPAKSVQENIIANFKTLTDSDVAGVATALGISNYEVITSTSFNTDDQVKIGTANITYREILANETSSGMTSDLVLVSMNCDISPLPMGESLGLLRDGMMPFQTQQPALLRFSLSYRAIIPRGGGTDTETYIEQIAPFMESALMTKAGLSTSSHRHIHIQARSVSTNQHEGTITVSWSGVIAARGAFIKYFETFQSNLDEGLSMDKIKDGQPFTNDIHVIGASLEGVHIISITTIGSNPPTLEMGYLGGNWVPRGRSKTLGPYENSAIAERQVSGSTRTVYYSSKTFNTSWIQRYVYNVGSGGGRKAPISGERGKSQGGGQQ